jgi:hypothetical protein
MAGRLLRWALTPDDSLNYDFLCAVYAFLAGVCLLLVALEHVYDAEGIKGWWIITAPCIPGLLYFLFLRARSRAAAGASKKKD